MDPPVSSTARQPPNPGRVQLPSIKELVNTLPHLDTYKYRSTRVLHSSSYTATASPSVVFSSASSGTSEPGTGSRVHSVHPPGSVSNTQMQKPQDPRTNSPISLGTATSLGSYRTIRPTHSLVSQIPSMHDDHQPPHGANLGPRLPMHSSGGATSTPRLTSTARAFSTQPNVAPALDQARGGKHYQNGQDLRTVPHVSDGQSHHAPAFPPPSSAGHHPAHHFIAPIPERSLPPRIEMDRRLRQYRAEGGVGNDQIQNRSHSQSSQSQSRADQCPLPWEHQNFRVPQAWSSARQLDPGDTRLRSTKYTPASQNSNDSPAFTTPGAPYQSHRTTELSGSREQDVGENRGDDHTGNKRGYGLRPARCTEIASPYQHEEMNSRRHEYHGQPANVANNQHGGIHHITAEDEHGILATRSDRRYQPILPAPSQPQRQYVSLEEQKLRPGPMMMMRNRRQGPDAGQDSVPAFAPRHATSTASTAHFPPAPSIRPPLPNGLIRRRSKDDLGRALQELTNEANRAMAEGKIMRKINEFARVVQLFSAHYARYPGPPAPSPEDVEEMSHRAVLIYRMAQAVKAKILAKKAVAANPSQATATAPLPSTRAQTKKKPITKEEKQVLDDMERIRRKRSAAQQGVKSKYTKRSKKTVAPKRCASCHTKETAKWKKGPDGPKSLCNACGLHWAKLQRKRKEDGQWIGEGAPPPVDIITLRQITGVGLQPRFNERGEFEIPGTYKNINQSLNWKYPSTSKVVPEVLMSDPSTNEHGSTSTAIPLDGAASTLMAISDNKTSPSASALPTEVNDIAIDQLSMEVAAFSQPRPQQHSPTPIHVPTHGYEGRGKKRKASRDHGDRDIDEDETVAPSLKRRRALSPHHIASNVGANGSPADTGQPPASVEKTIWQRAP